jgi:hypothetical protein
MHSTILIFHIVSMILSLGLMASATAALFFKTSTAAKLARFGMVTTLGGVTAGFILLVSSPLTIECLTLSAYLVTVTLAYRFAFGMGNPAKCLQLSR